MTDHKILLTGDFWHEDFQPIVSGLKAPTTLVPFEKVESVGESKFDLILIAQSRRDQHSANDVEMLQAMFPMTPLIAVLGSWCEGETRSGTPWPGVTRVYWHQWEGRYQNFVDQLAESGITEWHAPRTSTIGDKIAIPSAISKDPPIQYVAISAWTDSKHAMVADAIQHFGWQSCWVERGVWNTETVTAVDAICIEADAWSDDLASRIKWIQGEVPHTPMILLASYPRVDELKAIKAAGVSEVVSKPFELIELHTAIIRAIEIQNESLATDAKQTATSS